LASPFPLGLSVPYCKVRGIIEKISQASSSVTDALCVQVRFSCSRNSPWQPSKRSKWIFQSKASEHLRGLSLSERAMKTAPGSGCPASHLLPESMDGDSLHQSSDASPVQGQELSLGLCPSGTWTPLKSHRLIGSHPRINGWH
jgi:hypothetical protein